MADGFAVDRAALAETAQGLNKVIGALKGLGFDETAEVGRGFSGLALSGLQVGNGNLASAFGNFCDRWSWGVRALVQDGNQFAERLGLTAGLYNDVENKATGAIKDIVVAGVGDPHMTDQQAAAASWSQDAAGVTGAQTPDGNMTWQQAGQAAEKQWEGVGQTALGTPQAKAIKDLLGGG
ncbi:MAG TPA: hypothetical protein VF482_16375 [Trebonia sp.]